jgi:hypothetical protein
MDDMDKNVRTVAYWDAVFFAAGTASAVALALWLHDGGAPAAIAIGIGACAGG